MDREGLQQGVAEDGGVPVDEHALRPLQEGLEVPLDLGGALAPAAAERLAVPRERAHGVLVLGGDDLAELLGDVPEDDLAAGVDVAEALVLEDGRQDLLELVVRRGGRLREGRREVVDDGEHLGDGHLEDGEGGGGGCRGDHGSKG